ncbi:S-norcoclaurine synthase 1-like [Coffea eugenioides]|uniref:S-norcoclaurine synthase 1-like n=1 Tax=Coffea eugenioides TaxID=49369 RepID=UPI000F61584C|nr:S-norcoclaurine synthase 1-like [Coffea eugenioides]
MMQHLSRWHTRNKTLCNLTPHSDATGLTLLVQVNDVQGLQIKKSNTWVPIKPIPGAIIINIGDTMEIMSNGEYSSIEHRAVVDFHKERLSIAAFHSKSWSSSRSCQRNWSTIQDNRNREPSQTESKHQSCWQKLTGSHEDKKK